MVRTRSVALSGRPSPPWQTVASSRSKGPEMRTRLLSTTVIACALCVAVATATPASADAPDGNGEITFGRYDPVLGAHTVWVASPNGQNQRQLVTDPSSFSDWSPDGSRIAFDFADESGVHIGAISPDGSRRTTLTTEEGVQETPDWSPDGRWITYGSMDPTLPYFSTSIWIMRSDGTDARRVTTGGFDVEPVFSPDGRRIAFARIVEESEDGPQVNSLHVVDVDGTGERQVVAPRAGLEHPDWSPDGRWLGFDINPGETQLPDSGALVVVRPDGRAAHVLRAPTRDLRFFKIAWSPDGHRILMGCFDLRVQRDRLCISNAGGGGVRPIDLGDDSWVNFPAWGATPAR